MVKRVNAAQLDRLVEQRAQQICKRSRVDTSTGSLASELLGRNKYLQTAANWLGWGDYQISTNSLITGGSGMNSGARLVSTGARETRLVYREYIGDVFTHPTTAGDFYQQNYAINPGLTDVAPWISQIAQNYEQWQPNGILVEFVSTSGEITGDQALGKIIVATDYRADTLATKFSNVQEMLCEAYSQEAKPTSGIIHGIECAPMERTRNIYYTRTGGIPANSSLSDYDIAQVTVATTGGPSANTNLGSLYIHWDVTFFKPTLYAGVQNKGSIIRRWGAADADNVSALNWLSGTFRLTNSMGLAGGSSGGTIINPSNTWSDDFYFTKNGSGTQLYFPRWATVGSVWRIGYYIKGFKNVLSATITESPFVTFDLTRGNKIQELKTPDQALCNPGQNAYLGFYAEVFVRIGKHEPDFPFYAKVSFPATFFTNFNVDYAQLWVDSVPNWTTGDFI
jgi:hypothetical protein